MSDEMLHAAGDAFSAIGNPKYNALRLRLSLEIAELDNHRLSVEHGKKEKGGNNAELGRDTYADLEQRAYD